MYVIWSPETISRSSLRIVPVKALPSNVFAVPSACCNVIHSTVLGVDTFGLFICLSGGHIA